LLLGQNRIITYAEIEKNMNKVAINTDFRQVMLSHLRAGNMALIRKELHETFMDIVRRNLLVDHLYLVLSELVLTATTFAHENEINMAEIVGTDFTIMEIVELKETLEEAEQWFENLFQAVLNIYNKSKLYSYTKMVDKVKKHIDENYTNKDISLETIAANISINPSYLSNLFKKAVFQLRNI
jgi:two-component system, response regulator YesN